MGNKPISSKAVAVANTNNNNNNFNNFNNNFNSNYNPDNYNDYTNNNTNNNNNTNYNYNNIPDDAIEYVVANLKPPQPPQPTPTRTGQGLLKMLQNANTKK